MSISPWLVIDVESMGDRWLSELIQHKRNKLLQHIVYGYGCGVVDLDETQAEDIWHDRSLTIEFVREAIMTEPTSLALSDSKWLRTRPMRRTFAS